ncbi:MAG TPA: CRTAC1 family protein [Thermoanaerobaculia bacterium]|nr:CRTAC1 family protein [Thermoanaerobaculia bacterium]
MKAKWGLLAAGVLAACGEPAAAPPAPAAAPLPLASRFVDRTGASGVTFRHDHGGRGRRLLPETLGAGVAVFDWDGDGWPDLYFVQGGSPDGTGSAPAGTLLRNRGEGRFEDATARLRPGVEAGFYGMGTAVGDLDDDGDLDLVVSGVGRQLLFENDGAGGLAERARAWGFVDGGFGSSVALFDADADGRLDLFLGRYVAWSPATDVACRPDGVRQAYCTPEVYPPVPSRLFRNRGERRLVEAGRSSGIAGVPGKALGVVAADFDRDDRLDLAVANDTVRNFLFLNQGGSFREVGMEAGMALSDSGATRGGMGIDAGDADGDGRLDLVVGNFAQEMSAFFRSRPASSGSAVPLFADEAAQAGLGVPTLMTLAFGSLLFDAEGDGDLDLAFANGHIEPEIAQIRRGQTHAQPVQLFANEEPGHFALAEAPAGSALAAAYVGRGLATGDLDRDGDPDLVLTQNHGPAVILANEGSTGHGWLRLELVGSSRGGTPYGAWVRVGTARRSFERDLPGGRSYLSASEPVLTVGLGEEKGPVDVEMHWPGGGIETWRGLAPATSYRVVACERTAVGAR